MRKLLVILFLLFSVNAWADTITMPQYGTYDTLTASNLNDRWNRLTNQLNGGLTNDNANTTQGYRFIEILASTPSAGNQGRVVFNKTNNTLNFDTGVSFLATALLANTQTFTGTNTFSGSTVFTGNSTFAGTTIADLGSVTTADINDGTLDGVNIGTTTATGELFVNDSSDNADGLGSQGNSGQFLKSAGTGANPTWGTPGLELISVTALSTSNSGDITIAASKLYKVILVITSISADDTVGLRFDSDSGNDYNYFRHGLDTPGTNNAVDGGAANANNIVIGGIDSDDANSKYMTTELLINTNEMGNTRAIVLGHSWHSKTDASLEYVNISGRYQDETSLSSFEFFTSSANMTGTVYLYEYGLSL